MVPLLQCGASACAVFGVGIAALLATVGLTTQEGPTRSKVLPRLTTVGNAGKFFILIALVFGVANGFVAGIYETLPHMSYHFFSYGRIPATAAAAALAYCSVCLFGQRLTGKTLQIGIPIIALAFLILPYETQPVPGRFLGIVGYQFLMALFWLALSPYPKGTCRVPSAPPALLALLCGTPLGFLLWDLAGGAEATWNMQAVSIIAMFVLIMLMVFSARPVLVADAEKSAEASPTPKEAAGTVAGVPATGARTNNEGPSAIDGAHILAQRFGLTSRELEVCRLLGRGRNRQISGGDIAVCGSRPQADAGVEDSVEKYIQDMLTAGDNLNDVEKCRIIAEKSNEAWEWTRDVLGAEWESPRLDASVDCTNSAGATAEALCAAIECGALPVHLDWIRCGPWCSPDEEGYGVGPDLIDWVAAYSLDLNPQTGRRVCSELTDRKRYCDAILAVGEPLIQVVNEPNLPSYVAAKKDEQFGKAIPDDALPIEEGPFHITRRWPKVHHCMGGVKTDIDCRGQPTPMRPRIPVNH